MFNPTEIIFAATNSCNLHCSHCYVSRTTEKLNIQDSIRLLKSCENTPIDKIGFSGGEPFLYPEFLESIIKESIKCDFMFDRIMTNGVWWQNLEELQKSLQNIYDAGYDGKIGLSWDSFHNQDFKKILLFIGEVHKIFGKQSLEIQSVISENDDSTCVEKLAETLDCKIIKNINKKTGHGIIVLQNETIYLPIYRESQCFQAEDKRAWKSKKWFKDDYCEGPGQIFYVHSNGKIAPCCGFANESEQLIIGTIKDSYEQLMENAKNNSMVTICYETGLKKQLKQLKKQKILPPGKTDNLCTICEWISTLSK